MRRVVFAVVHFRPQIASIRLISPRQRGVGSHRRKGARSIRMLVSARKVRRVENHPMGACGRIAVGRLRVAKLVPQ